MSTLVKSFEVMDPIEIAGITLEPGHYMGMASWSGRMEDGREVEGPRSYYLQVERDAFEALGGVMTDNRNYHEIDVTQLMNEGRIR